MTNVSAMQSALSGLMAQRQRLDVIGHNIANATTEGYSRQRAELVSSGNGPIPALFSGGLVTGDGVDFAGITRYRDAFLESRFLGERGASTELSVRGKYLERVELVHNEPSDDGLSAMLGDFWSSFDEVANHPGGLAQRSATLEQAAATVDQFRFMDAQIRELRRGAVQDAGVLVARVNDLANEVAALNNAIRPLMLSKASPNDLLDQRDLALGELADLVGARVETRDDHTVDVFIGGSSLVTGDRSIELRLEEQPDPGLADVGMKRLVFTSAGGGEVVAPTGAAAGLSEVANTLVPDAIRALDGIANSFVTDVNALHVTGQDLDLTTGWNFFDPAGVTASTISISADVAGQPRRLAAGEVGAGEWDATIAQEIARLREVPGGADDEYAQLVGGLGVQVGSARARATAQAAALQRIDEARLSAKSVNIDEEMIDMIGAQRAYEASARVINAVDELLDLLVNRLGLVGR